MKHPPSTRASLILRLRKPGDLEAWEQFSDLYEPFILRMARSRGLQDADARDLTQEVMVRVAKSVGNWNPDENHGSFRGWLSRITRNMVVDFMRSRSRKINAVEFVEDVAECPESEDSTAANIVDAEKHLHEIAIACFNFESDHMRFPKNIDHDNDAKTNPTLSWRVEILPALGEQDLYNKFHLDEPWDSEHNISLISEMPNIFKSDLAENKFKTTYLGFGSKDAMFENGAEVRFGSISDGSSNTILCVEAAEDKAVVWTRPQDLDWNEDTKLEDLFRFNGQAIGVEGKPKYSFVVRCDGSTGFIRSDADRKNVEHAITINDGQFSQASYDDVFLNRK